MKFTEILALSNTDMPVPIDDTHGISNIVMEVQNAARVPGHQHGMYRASSSDHLPSVTVYHGQEQQTVPIARGNTFSAGFDKSTGVVKQFDSKGRLVAEDDIYGASMYHRDINPKTGLPTEGHLTAPEYFTEQDRRDHFGPDGRIVSSDARGKGWMEHGTFDKNSKESTVVRYINADVNCSREEVRTTTYKPDGSNTVDHLFPGRPASHFAEVNDGHGHTSVVKFDEKTGKPNEVLTDKQNFKIDQKTGKLSHDYFKDMKDAWNRHS